MDMRVHWVQDRIEQDQYNVKWEPGNKNKSDYFTNHYPATYHRKIQPTYLHCP
jgi:hypothetical protein